LYPGNSAENARAYAARGWPIFPVHHPTGLCYSPIQPGCSCRDPDCSRPGKHPRITQWQKYATLKPQVIEQWWERWPEANIGIRCGAGLMVLDVDCRDGKDGYVALAKLRDQHHWKLETFTVKTGGGGWHHYFQTPSGVSIPSGVDVLGPGLDIRANGGFVLAPPSLHACGSRYQVASDAPVACLPESILALLTKARPWKQDDGGPVYGGDRHDFLFRLACSLRGKGADEVRILEALVDVNQRRCIPPESFAELERQAHDVVLRYPAGHGKGSIMDNLYDSGVMRTLRPSVKDVFQFIREQVARDPNGVAELSYEDIGLWTGLARQAVSDGIRRLADIGLVEKRRTYNQTMGWRGRNAYRLTAGSQKFLQYLERCRAGLNPSLARKLPSNSPGPREERRLSTVV